MSSKRGSQNSTKLPADIKKEVRDECYHAIYQREVAPMLGGKKLSAAQKLLLNRNCISVAYINEVD